MTQGIYEDLKFPPAPEGRPYLIINTVATIDGRTAINGRAGPIGGEVDRRAMRLLRSKADAVMVGGGTLRAEKLSLGVPQDLASHRQNRGLKPQPLGVIVTESGDLPLDTNLIGATPENTLVFAPETIPKEARSRLSSHARLGHPKTDRGGRIDPQNALALLRDRYGIELLLVEGGPILNHTLISHRLADELFLTVAPKLLGGPPEQTLLSGPLLPSQVSQTISLLSAHPAGDELFLRYSLL